MDRQCERRQLPRLGLAAEDRNKSRSASALPRDAYRTSRCRPRANRNATTACRTEDPTECPANTDRQLSMNLWPTDVRWIREWVIRKPLSGRTTSLIGAAVRNGQFGLPRRSSEQSYEDQKPRRIALTEFVEYQTIFGAPLQVRRLISGKPITLRCPRPVMRKAPDRKIGCLSIS